MASADYAYSPNFIRKALDHIALTMPFFALEYLYYARRLYDSELETEEKERYVYMASGKDIIGAAVGKVIFDRFLEGPSAKLASVQKILGGDRSLELILASCVDHNYCLDEWRIWFGLIYDKEGWDVLIELLSDLYAPLLVMISSRLDTSGARSECTSNSYREPEAYRRPPPDFRAPPTRYPHDSYYDAEKEKYYNSTCAWPEPFPHNPHYPASSYTRPLALLDRIDPLESRVCEDQPTLLSRIGLPLEVDPHGPRGLLIRMGLPSSGEPVRSSGYWRRQRRPE